MKNNLRNHLLMIWCIFIGSLTMAQSVSQQEAECAALHFLKQKNDVIKSGRSVQLTQVRSEKEGTELLCYIFQVNRKGFIVVSADKNAPAILAYSESGGENLSGMNDSFNFWLNDIKKEIADVKNVPSLRVKDHSAEWRSLLTEEHSQTSEKSVTAVVGPLTTSAWGQSGYYNDLTPPDGNTCPAGCVALGMAQAFKYYEHPVKGKNTKISYLHNTTVGPDNTPLSYGVLSADLGSTLYNWANMPDTVNTPNIDVATLISHAGIAVKMNYKPIPNSSNAYYSEMANALKNIFGYTSSGALYRSGYTSQAWLNMIKSDLDQQRIVIMCGNDFTLGAGHCFVVDGYDNQDYLHINWGWNGNFNGYFLSTNISIRGYDFNGANHIYRIYPTCYSNLSTSELTPNSVVITNTEYAQTNHFQYRIAGSSEWTTIATTEAFITLNDLQPSTTYEYRDSILCSELGKIVSPVKTFATPLQTLYCPSQSKNSYYEWIQQITIGSLNNVSGKNNGYGDFTGLYPNVSKADTIPYTFTPGYNSSNYSERWLVWIDFNQDGDFADSSEQVINLSPVTGAVSGTFRLPAHVRSGKTRMRIVMSYYSFSDPCSNPVYGEVEDYTINITTDGKKHEPIVATNDLPDMDVRIYPNPSSGVFQLETGVKNTPVQLFCYNNSGQKVYNRTFFRKNRTLPQ